MNNRLGILVLILSVVVSISFTGNAWAEVGDVERGSDYTVEILPDNLRKWTGGLPTYIEDYSGNYVPYILTEDANIVQIESEQGSIVFDKSACAISFYKQGKILQGDNPILPSDSFTVRGAVNGTDNWNELSAINGASCETTIVEEGGNVEVWGTKHVDNQGTVIYKYIKKDGANFKSQIEVTNLNPAWNNHKLGLLETIHVPDIIKLGDTSYYIPDYDGTFVGRTWIANHGAEIVNILDGFNYDVGLGWDQLWGINVVYEGGQSKLVFDFSNQENVILPGETLVLDPVYDTGLATFTGSVDTTATTASTCSSTGDNIVTGGSAGLIQLGDSDISDDCHRVLSEWNTTAIPDSAIVTNVTLTTTLDDHVTGSDLTKTCEFKQMDGQPSTLGAQDAWDDTGNGTTYLTGFCDVDSGYAEINVAGDGVTTIESIQFKPDGTKMYVLDSVDDIYEYDLSSAWDITSQSFNQTFSVTTEDTAPQGLQFHANGTLMWMVGTSTDHIYEYSLSDPWNVTSASVGQNFNVTAQESNPMSMQFSANGTDLFISGGGGKEFNQYQCSNAWDLSSCSYYDVHDISSENQNPGAIFIHSNGTLMWMAGVTNADHIYEYSMSNPWDLTTISYTDKKLMIEFGGPPQALFFKSDGTKIFIDDNTGEDINAYDLSTAWDIHSAVIRDEIDLGASAATDLENLLSSDWFGLGIKYTNETRDTFENNIEFEHSNEFNLEVTYTAVPDPPTNLNATARSAEFTIDLAWTAPVDLGESTSIIGYQIERESPVGNGFSVLVNDTGSNSTTYVDSGLSGATQYNYRVSAWGDLSGPGATSNEANATTVAVPDQVTGLTATTIDEDQINLSWTAPNDNGSPITGYKIERNIDGAGWVTVADGVTYQTGETYEDFEPVHITLNGGVGTGALGGAQDETHKNKSPTESFAKGSHGLTEGKELVQMRMGADGANNHRGGLYESNTLLAVTPIFSGGPTWFDLSTDVTVTASMVSTGVTAGATGDLTNLIYGFAGQDGGSPWVSRGGVITYPNLADPFSTIGDLCSSCSIGFELLQKDNLDDGTLHDYRVSAINAIGTGSASTLQGNYTLPGAATSVLATTVSNSQINLSWNDPVNQTVNGYKIEIESPVGGGWTVEQANYTGGSPYTDTSLSAGTQYNYRLTSHNMGGVGALSAEASAWTATDAPTSLTGTQNADNTELDLSWTAPSPAPDSYSIDRRVNLGGWVTDYATGLTGLTYTDTGVALNTSYDYRVVGIKDGFPSAPSANFTGELISPTVAITGNPVSGPTVQMRAEVTNDYGIPDLTVTKIEYWTYHPFGNTLLETQSVSQSIAKGATYNFPYYFDGPAGPTDYFVKVTIAKAGVYQSSTINMAPIATDTNQILAFEKRNTEKTTSILEMSAWPENYDVVISYSTGAFQETPTYYAFENVPVNFTLNAPVASGSTYYIGLYVDPTFPYALTTGNNATATIPAGYPVTESLTSYADSTSSSMLGGIDLLGDIFGLPIPILFIIILGSVFVSKNAQMGVMFIVIATGIMNYMGLVDFGEYTTVVWIILPLLAVIGIFLGKRWS
jgi:hypothetical protein